MVSIEELQSSGKVNVKSGKFDTIEIAGKEFKVPEEYLGRSDVVAVGIRSKNGDYLQFKGGVKHAQKYPTIKTSSGADIHYSDSLINAMKSMSANNI